MENIKNVLIELAKAGIGIRECAAFVVVDGQTTRHIAEAVGAEMHTTATRLNTLARKELIERVRYDGAARWVKTEIGYDLMNRAGI